MGVATAVRRIGVYGGAFDPPHLAHLAMADSFVAQCQLDELRVLPTGQAWHKTHTTSPALHRLAMTRLAFADRPWAVVDEREMQRTGSTYTIDTLLELKSEAPLSSLFLLIGQDQWQRFATWKRWRDILHNATIVVASRAHSTSATCQNASESIAPVPSELAEAPRLGAYIGSPWHSVPPKFGPPCAWLIHRHPIPWCVCRPEWPAIFHNNSFIELY
jgi:nicotinate-nucleotide adenylyltransferase